MNEKPIIILEWSGEGIAKHVSAHFEGRALEPTGHLMPSADPMAALGQFVSSHAEELGLVVFDKTGMKK
jgi:hypothetical protein